MATKVKYLKDTPILKLYGKGWGLLLKLQFEFDDLEKYIKTWTEEKIARSPPGLYELTYAFYSYMADHRYRMMKKKEKKMLKKQKNKDNKLF